MEREQRIRGYDTGEGDYVEISEEDLDSVEIESTKTIDMDTFVEADQIDRVYFDSCYFCAPDDKTLPPSSVSQGHLFMRPRPLSGQAIFSRTASG